MSTISSVAAAVLFLPRIAIMTAAELFAFVVCVGATVGTETGAPLSSWRRAVVAAVVPRCCRILLWTVGFWNIRTKGSFAGTQGPEDSSGAGARIVVSNHESIVDGFILSALLPAPSFVARKHGLSDLPLYSNILRALQLVYVDKESSASRRATSAAIMLRCSPGEAESARLLPGSKWPPLVIFPEGTTNNSSGELLPFKPGAFRPGLPVQPVIIRYRSRSAKQNARDSAPESSANTGHTPLSKANAANTATNGANTATNAAPWSLMGEVMQLVSLLFAVSNPCEVAFLPEYTPSERERADAGLYAANVREAMQRYMRDAA